MAAPSNVKTLIRRFELLASYSSVPNVRSEFLVGSTYHLQRTQQPRRPYTQLDKIQELEGGEVQKISKIQSSRERKDQRELRRISSEGGSMSASAGYLALPSLRPQGMGGYGSASLQPPLGSGVKPRSPYNSLTLAEIASEGDGPAELTTRVGDYSANKADCGSAMHCTSAPRHALRRLGQSVKQKASFFIEQNQKQDDLPLRKSPPPKRLFGENMGRKVSRKVMEKVEAVRRVSEDYQRKGLMVLSRAESNREGEKRSSGDGADDDTLAGSGVVMIPLGREGTTGTSTERESVGTGPPSSWSSTSYPLTSPTTPPVMRRMPSKFIHRILKRSLKPPAAIDGPADSEHVSYKGGPQRTPEVKQVPSTLQRGNSSTASLLPMGGSRPGSIAEQGLLGTRKSRIPWRNWSGANRRGMDGIGDVDDGDKNGTIRKKRITPPKVSVRSLIARFRQAESVDKIGNIDWGAYRSRNREPDSVEVQFDEENDEDCLVPDTGAAKGESGSVRKKPKRSVSIRTFQRASSVAGEQGRARSATYTFVSEDDYEAGTHTDNHSRHGQKQPKPYLHSGSGKFRLRITSQNEKFGETDQKDEDSQDIGNYNERRKTERRSIGAMSKSHNCAKGNVRSRRQSVDESSETEVSLPSLTSTDTIITTKNSSGSHRPSDTYISEDERSQEDRVVGGYGMALRGVGEDSHGYTSGSESGRYEIPKQLGPVGADPVSMASMGSTIRHGPQQLIQSAYRYSNVGRVRRNQHLEAYRGTPAPVGFILRGEIGERQQLSEEVESWGSGNGSGEGLSHNEEQEEGSDSSPASDEIGYVYVDDDDISGEELDEVLSNSDSEVGSAGGYEERETEASEEDIVGGEPVQSSTRSTPALLAQKTSLPQRPPQDADPGLYPTPRTTSAARRLIRQHEAATRVVGTILFDGVDVLSELDDIEVVGLENGSSSREGGLDKGREWEELMEEEESEEIVRVKLPVRGIPVSGRIVQPKVNNYVMRVAVEKFVLAWG